MGDGIRLKKILDEKGIKVPQLSRETTINPQTLYAIINKDRAIRFDFALRIANVLGIEPSEICSDTSFSDENDNTDEAFPPLPSGLDSILDKNRIKRYLTNSMYPLMALYGKENMPDIDELLTYYYQLTDEGRLEVKKYVQERYTLKKDEKRSEEIKHITRW